MTTMTRRQLFDLIWSKPMRDAATEIGISDVGLKKVCTRHRVPVPPQGYWNKVHAGQKPQKAVFHEVSDRAIDHIEIAGSSYCPTPVVKKALTEAKVRERAPDKRIEVAPKPPTLAAAVQLAASLKGSKHDDKDFACGFRRKSATHSDLKSAADSDLKPATCSDGSRPPIPI